MAFTHTFAQNCNDGAVNTAKSRTVTDALVVNFDHTIADSVTDDDVVVAVDVSQLKSLYVVSTQDVTMEWNDGSGTQGSIALKAGAPLIWISTDGYYGNPLGATDVSTLYFTNASGASADITFRALVDPTP